MRSLQEIYLPILEIANSLLVGILFFALQALLATTSIESISLIGRYPDLLVISGLSSLFGYLFNSFIDKSWKTRLSYFVNIGIFSVCIWIFIILDRPVLLESIFYQNSTRLLIGFSFFLIGVMLSGQKEVQKGGFLLGIIFYLFLGDWLNWTTEDLKILLLVLFLCLVINYILRTYIDLKNQFLPTRLLRRNYKYFIPLYQSFIILFVLTMGTFIYRNIWELDLTLTLFLTAYIITRSIAIYKIPEQIHRYGFIYGRYILTASFILYASSFSWNNFFYTVLVLNAIGLGFYRPSQSNEKVNLFPILLGIGCIFIFGFLIFIAKYNIMLIHFSFILFIIIYYPIQKNTVMNPIDKQAPLMVGLLFSFFLFQVPTKGSSPIVRIQSNTSPEPIPFYLSDLFEQNRIYTFIQSNLPFESALDFPTEDQIAGTVPILGFNIKDKYLKYYSEYLTDRKIPHYIVVSSSSIKNDSTSSILTEMNHVSFPGFEIYYYPKSMKPSWSSQLSKDWKFSSIQERLQGIKDWKEYHSTLNQVYNYGGAEIKSEALKYKALIHESVMEYCKFFSDQGRYLETIECINLSLNFGELNPTMKQIAFGAMNFTTASNKHINLLQNLSKDPNLKVKSLSKLYPIYDSINDYKNTVETIAQLKIVMQEEGLEEDLQDLEIEEARFYIRMNKWEEASSTISYHYRKYPDSIVWQRLNDELEKWKETRKLSWAPRPKLETKNIK